VFFALVSCRELREDELTRSYVKYEFSCQEKPDRGGAKWENCYLIENEKVFGDYSPKNLLFFFPNFFLFFFFDVKKKESHAKSSYASLALVVM
jgi:hypothetical protein